MKVEMTTQRFYTKSWKNPWSFPQIFYGCCVPDGTNIGQLLNRQFDFEGSDKTYIKDIWGDLSSSFVFISKIHANQKFYAFCTDRMCFTCEPVKRIFEQTKIRTFTWICIARKRLNITLPKDVIRMIALLIE